MRGGADWRGGIHGLFNFYCVEIGALNSRVGQQVFSLWSNGISDEKNMYLWNHSY
jgi:hypothetical protein